MTAITSAISCGGSSRTSDNAGGGTPGGGGSTTPPYPGVMPNGEIHGEGNFANLVKKYATGKPKSQPWAGYWWPYSQGGTSDATSLYDRARPGSGATSWELSNHGPQVPGIQSWYGHCNGWSAAAVMYQEPRATTSADGVSFTVADQKSLLSELAMEVNADFFGTRNDDNNPSSPSFQDVAPDVFFLVMTNYLGNGLGVVIDRYTGNQVWNQPVAGYQIAPITKSDYLGASPAAPGVYRVMVSTQIWWGRDDVQGGHLTEPFAFADTDSFESRTLRFEIWLDAPLVFDGAGAITSSGQVIVGRQGNTAVGGVWRTEGLELVNSHPDYIWVPHNPTPSTGYSNPHIDPTWLESHFGHRNT
jgi:hypothetical protein